MLVDLHELKLVNLLPLRPSIKFTLGLKLTTIWLWHMKLVNWTFSITPTSPICAHVWVQIKYHPYMCALATPYYIIKSPTHHIFQFFGPFDSFLLVLRLSLHLSEGEISRAILAFLFFIVRFSLVHPRLFSWRMEAITLSTSRPRSFLSNSPRHPCFSYATLGIATCRSSSAL